MLPDPLILVHDLVPPSGRSLIPSRFGIRRWPDGRSEASAIVSDERTVCRAVFCRQSVERRSEERRVGKEGRSRWSAYHLKKHTILVYGLMPLARTRVVSGKSVDLGGRR